MGKKFACHKISEGKAQAEAIISKDRIMFYQVRPEDGMMEEKNHYLEGHTLPSMARASHGRVKKWRQVIFRSS